MNQKQGVHNNSTHFLKVSLHAQNSIKDQVTLPLPLFREKVINDITTLVTYGPASAP